MQRLHNITKWKRVQHGEAVNFSGTKPRRVRLDVNAPAPVAVYYNTTEGALTFLALVEGRDCIEFHASGEFAITVDGGDLWWDTTDSEDHSFVIPDAVILTEIVERRPRNREMEMMNYMMNANMKRMLDAQREELEGVWARREAAARAAAAKQKPAGDDAGVATKPVGEPDAADVGSDKSADDGDKSGKPAKR